LYLVVPVALVGELQESGEVLVEREAARLAV